MKNHITFKKLVLLFCAVIVPFFLLSLFLLWENNTAIQNRLFSSIQEKATLTARSLTETMEQIYDTAVEVADQTNLKRLANPNYPMSSYDTTQNIMQIKEQQTSIKNANRYIDNFVIYYREREQAYNCDGDGMPSYFEFTQEEYQSLTDMRKASDFLILKEQQLSEVIQPVSESNFLIRVDLSAQTITTLLKETFVEYEVYYLLDAFDHSYQLTNLSEEWLSKLEEAGQTSDASPEASPSKETSSNKALSDSDRPVEYTFDGTRYYCFTAEVPYGEMKLSFFFSRDQLFADTKVYQNLTLYFGLFVLIVCFIFLWGCYHIIHKPIQTLINAIRDINRQNYDVRIPGKKNSDFSYLYQEFNHMAEQLGTLIEKDYQKQLLLNKAELKQLQAQINPHFLYNSLFLLRNMIYDGLHEEALKMADTLGQYFQYITRNSQDYMPLGREYNHAILYCDIQNLRFEGRIRVETDPLPETCSGILVPKLILQPLLENSFNYGLKDKVEGGLLKVSVSTDASNLTITVEDNGESLSEEKLTEMQQNLLALRNKNTLQEITGILNIQRRLNIYFDGSGYLSAGRSPLGGLCVQLILPFM